jgi:hypothetical protein
VDEETKDDLKATGAVVLAVALLAGLSCVPITPVPDQLPPLPESPPAALSSHKGPISAPIAPPLRQIALAWNYTNSDGSNMAWVVYQRPNADHGNWTCIGITTNLTFQLTNAPGAMFYTVATSNRLNGAQSWYPPPASSAP